jgi:hypothetical protein
MTIYQLSRWHDINALIMYHKQQLAELLSRTAPGAQMMTGMPHTPGAKDKLGELVPIIVDLERQIEGYEREKQIIDTYIDSISDWRIKLVFELKFRDSVARTWAEAASAIAYARYSGDAARMIVIRYLAQS